MLDSLTTELRGRDLAGEVNAAVAQDIAPPLILISVDDRAAIADVSREASSAIAAAGLPVVPATEPSGGEPAATLVALEFAEPVEIEFATAVVRCARQTRRLVAIVYPTYLGCDVDAWEREVPNCVRIRVQTSTR